MLDENIRLAREQAQAESKKKDPGLISEISGIFSQMSGHDRNTRQREKIREDLVRRHFETEPVSPEQLKNSFAAQLGKLLRLD